MIKNKKSIVQTLMNKTINMMLQVYDYNEVIDFFIDDKNNPSFGDVDGQYISEVIESGNVREQLNLLSKLFSSYKNGIFIFPLGQCLYRLHNLLKSYQSEHLVNVVNVDILKKEYDLIPQQYKQSYAIQYDYIKGSSFFTFDEKSYVYQTRCTSIKTLTTEYERINWDKKFNAVIKELDPPLSYKEEIFISQHRITNIGLRLYNAMNESGTAYIFGKLAQMLNFTSEELFLLNKELIHWLSNTHNHTVEHVKKSCLY